MKQENSTLLLSLISTVAFSLAAPAPSTSATAAPFTPSGGLGTNSSPPVYSPLSDFDFQSLNLALNQELIELDLFHHGLAQFSVDEFKDAGLNEQDLFLIQFMADQEVGHAKVLTDILGSNSAKACEYQYPFATIREFIDFCQKLTRVGESGVYGFLEHLDSRPSAQILLQSISTEARQQMILRQFEGLFPMPVWHETGITQSMAWSLLSPYLKTCPAENPRIEFQIFPGLNITNNPNVTELDLTPGISNNVTSLSAPGREVQLAWETPGKVTGYNDSYTTNTTAGEAKFVAWISQLNVTYTDLNVTSANVGTTIQPGGDLYGNGTAPIINGTMFIAITDSDPLLTPFNISMINRHIVAGPALYQSD
ncbi:Rds1 protein [Lentinula edodes]|uniref:Rds1 protein n=1 Tax=Lentinula lateritia TaxID=40482 RepID=A0A9W9E0W7_9AGAR|nr:Rds1 protein [Lentinula edodes]